MRIADQEREMELGQQFYRHNGRIALFGDCIVRIRSVLSSAAAPSGHFVCPAGAFYFIFANAVLDLLKRWSDAGGLAIWRE